MLNRVIKNQEPGQLHFIEDEMLKLKLEGVKDFTSFLAVMENSSYAHLFVNTTPENLTSLNNSFDRFHFNSVLNEINKCKDEKAAMPFREYWAANIDLINLRLILRKIAAGDDFIGFSNFQDLLIRVLNLYYRLKACRLRAVRVIYNVEASPAQLFEVERPEKFALRVQK